ncbi:uncharacterized protein [Procambarus clarkii]|uniref:uncharacterized protein isoform X3 n=1 Tax=Procambarus clarkii TaxID=6728 RepID=UPI00374423A7
MPVPTSRSDPTQVSCGTGACSRFPYDQVRNFGVTYINRPPEGFKMPSGKSLNVVQRESFFDDSFFKESWEDFERAIQSVLDKFDNKGLKVNQGSRSECRDVYSKIRTSKIDEDLYASQALQITEKDGKFQAVMDVKDFNPRELQVRAVDDRIVVEGSYQKVSEDGSSSSSKSFYKEFTLPSAADIDLVTTALSKDGVLTIKAPKKEGAAVTVGPKNSSSSTSSIQQSSFSDGGSTSSFKSSSSKMVIQSSSSFESSSTDGLESLPKEMREKLMFSDSGFGSTKTSTCSSPAPSEVGSESSRVSSTMEFDLAKKAPTRTEVAFNVTSPSQPTPQPIFKPVHQQGPNLQQPPQPQFQQPPQPQFQPPSQPQFQPPSQPQFQPPSQPQFQPPSQPQFQPPSQPQFQPPSQPQFQPLSQPQFQPPSQPQFQPPSQPQFQPPSQPQFQPPSQPQFQQPPQPQFQQPPQPQFQQPPQPQFQPPTQPQFQPPTQPQFQQPTQPQFQQPTQPQFQQPPEFSKPSQFLQQQINRQMFQQFPQPAATGFQPMAKTAPRAPFAPTQVVGSGNQSNISVTEENGRRILTSQTSNVVQEKDGFMEHRETAAEIKDKDSQAARREATTKISRQEEDPEGKSKLSEAADAAEVSESCIQHMPDGSIMSVKKSSSSASSVKKSFSSTGDAGSFFQTPDFPTGFGDLKNLMNRGQSLMSQMSTDSMASTLSGRSGFSDMSNFSHFSDTSSQYSGMSNFSNMSNFSDMSPMSPRSQNQNVPSPGSMAQDFNSSRVVKSFSSSSTFNKSSFSSNLGDKNF